jgi:hypothetical protein
MFDIVPPLGAVPGVVAACEWELDECEKTVMHFLSNTNIIEDQEREHALAYWRSWFDNSRNFRPQTPPTTWRTSSDPIERHAEVVDEVTLEERSKDFEARYNTHLQMITHRRYTRAQKKVDRQLELDEQKAAVRAHISAGTIVGVNQV